MSLTNLAWKLEHRYTSSKDIADLEEATSLFREALVLRPPGHPTRALVLSGLANSLLKLREESGLDPGLEEALSLEREALLLCPPGHCDRPASLINLASMLQTRYDCLKERSDLEEAIPLFREAVQLLPGHNPNRTSTLDKLCFSLKNFYLISSEPSQLSEIKELLTEAFQDHFSLIQDRFLGALSWAREKIFDDLFRLELYGQALSLLHQLVEMSPGISVQYRRLTASQLPRDIAVDAAGEAIAAGKLERSVSMLEQGRGVLLSILQRYRTPIDDLRKVNPKLADKLQSIGSRLKGFPQLHLVTLGRGQQYMIKGMPG